MVWCSFHLNFCFRAAFVYLPHKLEKCCFSLLYILWCVFICLESLLAENEFYDLSELPEVVEDQLLFATKWYSNPLLFGGLMFIYIQRHVICVTVITNSRCFEWWRTKCMINHAKHGPLQPLWYFGKRTKNFLIATSPGLLSI